MQPPKFSERDAGTSLALLRSVQALAVLAVLVPSIAIAGPAKKKSEATEPLWEAEIELGYGMSKTTSAEMVPASVGPMSFAALAAVAINDEPHAYAVGGLVGEAIQRYGIGVTAGARLVVPGTPVRLTGTGVWMVAPDTLWGASAAAGACFGHGALGVCGDLQLTAYFAGTGLPKDELEMQVAFMIGFVARGGM